MGEGQYFVKVPKVSLEAILKAQYAEILRLRRSIEKLTLSEAKRFPPPTHLGNLLSKSGSQPLRRPRHQVRDSMRRAWMKVAS